MSDPINPSASLPKMKLIKFGGTWCSPCQAQEKTQLLEKFCADKPHLTLKKINLPETESEEGKETPDEISADEFDVTALPTIIFCSEDEQVIFADVGGAVSPGGLEKLYQKALKKAQLP